MILLFKTYQNITKHGSYMHTTQYSKTYLEEVIFCTIFEKWVVHCCLSNLLVNICRFRVLLQLCRILCNFQQTLVSGTKRWRKIRIKGILWYRQWKPALYDLSGFYHMDADCFYRNGFLLKKLSNLSSFRAIQGLIASQWTFEK